MSTPDPLPEVGALIRRLAAHQAAQDLADAALVRQCPALGSPRTWQRLVRGEWALVPPDRWLPILQKICAAIEQPGDTAPIGTVTAHLSEADRCRRSGHLVLARGHCRAARRAVEAFQRGLTPRAKAES